MIGDKYTFENSSHVLHVSPCRNPFLRWTFFRMVSWFAILHLCPTTCQLRYGLQYLFRISLNQG
jgi:hypothetical protein